MSVQVEVNRTGKPWYKSKTFWAGTLETIGGIAMFAAGEIEGGTALTAAGLVTIILRFLTKEEVKFK